MILGIPVRSRRGGCQSLNCPLLTNIFLGEDFANYKSKRCILLLRKASGRLKSKDLKQSRKKMTFAPSLNVRVN